MSLLDNLNNFKNTIENLIKNIDSYVLLERNDKFKNKNPNARFIEVYYNDDERECIIRKDIFENWKYYIGLQYCDTSCFDIIGNYVIIYENDDRIEKLFELFDEMLDEQNNKE